MSLLVSDFEAFTITLLVLKLFVIFFYTDQNQQLGPGFHPPAHNFPSKLLLM